MKRLLIIATAGCACLASGQATGKLDYVYDLKYREAALVTSTKIGTVKNVLGKGFELDVDGFAGLTLVTKRPVSGILLDKRFSLADNVTGHVGLGLSLGADRNPSLAFGFGVGWRF